MTRSSAFFDFFFVFENDSARRSEVSVNEPFSIKTLYNVEACEIVNFSLKYFERLYFKTACETFCLDNDESVSNATLQGETLTIDTVRLVPVNETISLDVQLGKYHSKSVTIGKAKIKPKSLHCHSNAAAAPDSRSTILVEMIANDVQYQPGDHVGIFPANRENIVDGILERLSGVDNFDEVLQLQMLKENHSTNGTLLLKIKYAQMILFTSI